MSKHRTRNRRKRVAPDEYFAAGPLEFARFGKLTVARSRSSEKQFAAMQQKAVAQFPIVVRELDELVARLADLVRVLPPEQVLHRAWWNYAMAHMGIEAEASMDREHALAMRMIDYVQSMIASVTPSEAQRNQVTDTDWQTLSETVAYVSRQKTAPRTPISTWPSRSFASKRRRTGAT